MQLSALGNSNHPNLLRRGCRSTRVGATARLEVWLVSFFKLSFNIRRAAVCRLACVVPPMAPKSCCQHSVRDLQPISTARSCIHTGPCLRVTSSVFLRRVCFDPLFLRCLCYLINIQKKRFSSKEIDFTDRCTKNNTNRTCHFNAALARIFVRSIVGRKQTNKHTQVTWVHPILASSVLRRRVHVSTCLWSIMYKYSTARTTKLLTHCISHLKKCLVCHTHLLITSNLLE